MKKTASSRPKSITNSTTQHLRRTPRGEYKKTAQLLRKARTQQGLSQTQVAQEFNYHGQHIANWEAGVSLPPVETLNKLSKILKIPVRKMIDLRIVEVRQKWLSQLKHSK